MKKILLFTCAIIAQQTIAQIPTAGLIAHYEFDNDATDASANGYTLVSSNVTYETDRNGNASSCVRINPSNSSSLNFNYGSALASDFEIQSYSVGAWIVFASPWVNEYQSIMEIGPQNTNFFRMYKLNGAGSNTALLQVGHRSPNAGYQTSTASGLNTNAEFLSWHHYLVTSEYNTTTDTRIRKIYVDGQLHSTYNYIAGGQSQIFYDGTIRDLRIGLGFNGALDDFVLYNRALTAAEAAQIPACLDVETNIVGNSIVAHLDDAGTTYQWVDCDNGNNPIPGATNQIFNPTVSGNYAVEISTSGCTSNSACTQVTIGGGNPSSVIENEALNFNIYPNPANSNVSVSNVTAGSTVTIIDVMGKRVYATKAVNTTIDLSVENLSNGLYFIEIENNGAVAQKKLVVSK